MHSIIFHIAGIAILEICFYFYYIGPVESQLFQQNINLLIKEPLQDYNQIKLKYNLQQLLTNISNTELITVLHNDYINGRNMREKRNYDLFIYTIKCWCVVLVLGIIIYGIKMKYNNCIKNKTLRDNVYDVENNDLWTENYRKNSIDETDNNSVIIQLPSKKYNNKIIYYVVFGSCVIFFEYAFFQYIVMKYNPLSIYEMRYIIFRSFLNE